MSPHSTPRTIAPRPKLAPAGRRLTPKSAAAYPALQDVIALADINSQDEHGIPLPAISLTLGFPSKQEIPNLFNISGQAVAALAKLGAVDDPANPSSSFKLIDHDRKMLEFWLIENRFQGIRNQDDVPSLTQLISFVQTGPNHYRGEGHVCVIGGIAVGGPADARLNLAIIALATNAIAQGYANPKFNARVPKQYHPPEELAQIVCRCIRPVAETCKARRLMCIHRAPHQLEQQWHEAVACHGQRNSREALTLALPRPPRPPPSVGGSSHHTQRKVKTKRAGGEGRGTRLYHSVYVTGVLTDICRDFQSGSCWNKGCIRSHSCSFCGEAGHGIASCSHSPATRTQPRPCEWATA